jgi:hypothetical protein
MRRFRPIAFVLLIAVALLLTRVGQPLPLSKPPSASDEEARALTALAAEVDLEPADSLFSQHDEPDPYDLALRDALLPSPGLYKCQLVVVPSFDPEWAIFLKREDGSAPHLVSRGLRRHLRAEMMNVIQEDASKGSFSAAQNAALKRMKVDVDTSQAVVTGETADMLEEVWEKMLDRVGYPATFTIAVDGVHYHASHWSALRGPRSGQTTSPPQGSRPYALVMLAEQMRGFTQKPSPEAEARLRDDASTLLSALKSAVQSRSESSPNPDRSAAQ